MIINRHNYEAFFLLYTDNELKDTERAAVENFVKQNPDFADELEMLQRSTLADEDIVFDKKELLYRREKGVLLNNYEEYFLLSADNELNKEQSNELEKFILKHPDLQKEFTLLMQTRLEPEIISFAGKEILYRKTRPKRIVPIWLMRMSVAAAIIAFVATMWIYIQNNGSAVKNNGYAISKKVVKKSAEKNNQLLVRETVKDKLAAVVNDTAIIKHRVSKSDVKNNNDVKNIAASKEKINTKKPGTPQEILAFKKPENNIESKPANADNNTDVAETETPEKKYANPAEISTTNENSNNVPKMVTDERNKPIYASNQKVEEPALAIHAVYREIDTNDDDRSLYIGGADINKNKLKGLFKKAAAFLEKKRHKNDND